MVSPRIRVQAKDGRVEVGVQMRPAVHAYACCPRHNEPFGVLLASLCMLCQPVQPQSSRKGQPLVLQSSPKEAVQVREFSIFNGR